MANIYENIENERDRIRIDVRKAFQLYKDLLEDCCDLLSLEESGILLNRITNYVCGYEVEEGEFDSAELKMAWRHVKRAIDRDTLSYIEKCNKNSDNIKQRYAKE